MDRCWLLTSTTYGTWLPGDRRGFVGRVRDGEGGRVIHNVPGTPYDADVPALRQFAQDALRGPRISLTAPQARVLLDQFRQTTEYRRWVLWAVAIMADHFHLVITADSDVAPADMLRDFKSYGSRALSRVWQKPASGTWWTASGSRRLLPDKRALLAAIRYVETQKHSLAVWVAEGCRHDEPDEPGA